MTTVILKSGSKRKRMPSIDEICEWYLDNPPEWFHQLWSGMAGLLMSRCKETISSYCWLTKKKGKLIRCHIVPDGVGGSNHPSNFVLLRQEVHARCPNTSDAAMFIDWLLAERKKREDEIVPKMKYAYELAFSNVDPDKRFNVAGVFAWIYSKDIMYTDLCKVESITPFPTDDNNLYVEDMFLVKSFMQKHKLFDIKFGVLSKKLDEIYATEFVSHISPEPVNQQ